MEAPERKPNPRPAGYYFWEGCRVRLRAVSEADTRIWLEAQYDSETVRLLDGITLPATELDRVRFFEKWGEFRGRDELIMFTIETLDGEVVGGVNINSINHRAGTFCVGSVIHRQHRGRGFFEEAKRIVLRYCFYELRLQKYNATTLETNEAMVRHFTRIGAQPEGRRRRDEFTNGRYYDNLMYGLTREEFEVNDAAWLRENGLPPIPAG